MADPSRTQGRDDGVQGMSEGDGPMVQKYRVFAGLGVKVLLLLLLGSQGHVEAQGEAHAVAPPATVERAVGPYNVHVLAGGGQLLRPVPVQSHVLHADGDSTLALWVQMSADVPPSALIAGVGDPLALDSRYIGLLDGRPMVRLSATHTLVADTRLPAAGWHLLVVTTHAGQATLYADGAAVAHGQIAGGMLSPELLVAPVDGEKGELRRETLSHFGGSVAGVTLLPEVFADEQVRQLAARPLETALLRWDEASPPWPMQTRGHLGYLSQQDPSLLPHSKAPFSKPVAKLLPPMSASALVKQGDDRWTLAANWSLAAAPQVHASPASLSSAGFDTSGWMRATVPGTVLTTMIDRGIYPDPDFGLNNLAIPESLSRQDYWYRVEFPTPVKASSRFELTFEGINYAAEVWLNGRRLGEVTGAFIRGGFDVTGSLQGAGQANALAVRVSPAPHPGIPHEQSLLGGPGENGGDMVLDGPTFSATEGWDWIPAIRDRNTGIWQDVTLTAHSVLQVGDVRVLTRLPLPDVSSADLTMDVPIHNDGSTSVSADLHLAFEGSEVIAHKLLPPGDSVWTLSAEEYPALHLQHPRLWWPNGYGKPELYHLSVSLETAGSVSSRHSTTFGVREVTYEESLFDAAGHLRRVEVSPTEAHLLHQRVVDVTHSAMRLRGGELAASSLTPAGETSSAVKLLNNDAGLTDLVLKVNGVRIAARGGNWGMDDSRKRVSRDRLEPYFRLHRDANVNIIRNWMGQDTEETFFELADEYGMMVWNDFWESTQDYNAEAQDVPLFLKNARDTVRRYRNHPSIVMWCGRNEGVPQPILNEGLIALLDEEDGTRYYSPSSNRVNLRNSGPYHYEDPKLYYTTLNRGFSVEVGLASLSTLESLQASIAPADLWPISDAWAYHDWHASGNGDVHYLMTAMDRQLGASADLKDFERKAQLLNYVDHRAVFEGFNQHLWQPNSGRMLWMTHPAWPSNVWQIYSSDYDTNASFYGVKKACEPLHIQMDLSDFTVAAVNTTGAGAGMVRVHAGVYSLSNQLLLTQDSMVDLHADDVVPTFALALAPLFQSQGVVLVELTMNDASGRELSRNVYWLAANEADYRKLNTLPLVRLNATAKTRLQGTEAVIDLHLANNGSVAAVAAKAVLTTADGQRILPAYLSDNYVTLLPGETTVLSIRIPQSLAKAGELVRLRGWNIAEDAVPVKLEAAKQ